MENKVSEKLRSAIMLVLGDRSRIHYITAELYPAIAEEFNVTPSKVERAIRHAISKTGHKMTNSEFIGVMAERLSLEDKQ